MRKNLFVVATAVLAFYLGGCDNNPFGGSETTTQQSPVASSPAPTQPSPTSPAFAQPTVEGQNAPKGILPPDLISSTNPAQRVQQVRGNRSDPFSLVPTTPTVENPPQAAAPPSSAQASPPSAQAPSAQNRRSAQAPRQNSSGRLAPIPTLVPRSPVAAAPPRPQPDLARAVQVTGVVQIGDTPYAIVNAPNEPTSRYVQVGQRLSNGQILVRRIEMNGSDPVVVLEQYGIEVVTAVGGGGAPTSPTTPNGTPAAFAPSTGTGPAT
jgi:hypothetical protein